MRVLLTVVVLLLSLSPALAEKTAVESIEALGKATLERCGWSIVYVRCETYPGRVPVNIQRGETIDVWIHDLGDSWTFDVKSLSVDGDQGLCWTRNDGTPGWGVDTIKATICRVAP